VSFFSETGTKKIRRSKNRGRNFLEKLLAEGEKQPLFSNHLKILANTLPFRQNQVRIPLENRTDFQKNLSLCRVL